ncbi:MAG TPA: hypothetical protein PK668_21575 [Myxococcota bacterium]|nr:hypothetical protein [Myxococcota bacterium]HRY96069.1 hypothetical protein [Myxococcota bacterium]
MITRAVLPLVALLAAAGCGSSGGGSTLFDGFVPTGGSALVFAPATCEVPFVGSTALAGIALDFTSYADSCGVITQTQLCGNKASATRVLAIVLSGDVGATSIDPAGPGQYPYLAEPPTGAFRAATAEAVQDDATCEPLAGTSSLDMTGGSVTLSEVTGGVVRGSASIRFENGETFEHTFALPLCAATIDLCARFNPCMDHTCVP